MEETLKLIAERLTKDCYDYLAMFAPLLLSIVAIIVAIVVPKVIANKQDKISIFDKRFKSYDVLQKYIAFSDMLKSNKNNADYNGMIVVIFFNGDGDNVKKSNALLKILEVSTPLKYIPFLFKDISEEEVEFVIKTLGAFVGAILQNKDIEFCKNVYIDTVQRFCDKHLENIKEELKKTH